MSPQRQKDTTFKSKAIEETKTGSLENPNQNKASMVILISNKINSKVPCEDKKGGTPRIHNSAPTCI